jgi:nucleoside 2-deoxyribosyltransferase
MKDEMSIYLVGYIHGKVIDKCMAWRKKIRDHYDNWKGTGQKYPLVWIDPCNGSEVFNLSLDGLKSAMPANAIVHKDYNSVVNADIIIANMDTFGEERPLTGSICELAWAWDKHKPIIMITDEDKYRLHPFMSYFASWIVSSVDELLEKKIINELYKSIHSAQY